MANVDELISSIFSDINTYTGKDPLLPWLRGIRKLKENLPSKTLKEKLPEFLRKCTQTFELDRRYRNDLRYLRVWLHLMDFVDDPSALLRTMEVNQIGTKRCQFYQAYALYYEKSKNYDEAEKMYHMGVKNLAEPVDELQKSYEQFLQRMKRKKKIQEMKAADRRVKAKNDESKRFRGDHTVVINKFVDTAMDGKSEAENACHHGLVDPTINMKEAMNAINSMFSEPLETVPLARKSHKNNSKESRSTQNNFEVFVDDNLDNEIKPSGSSSLQQRTEASKPQQESLQIYIDDEGCSEGSTSSAPKTNGFVFPRPKDVRSEKSRDMDAQRCGNSKFREDTVVRRFVGSAILDEPKVENACHHGLVDPTINMKEAMNDINSMFGKPIDFVRKKRSVKQEKAPETNNGKDFGGFSILADDDDDLQPKRPPLPKPLGKSKGSDLFEPTLHTKEAMDDINNMFNMPLDF
ncbi:hypothetical protein P8452_20795 [Trifolium repens]|nr:hypothetical protein P8452_20795 [Trifolium repens]